MKNTANQTSTRYDAEPAPQQGPLEVGDFAGNHGLRDANHSAAVTQFPPRPASTISAHGAMPEHAQDQGGASFTPMHPKKLLIAAIVIPGCA